MEQNQSFWDSKAIKIIVGIVTIVALIEILSKLFGKSEDDKKAELHQKQAHKAREKGYTEVKPSYTDNVYEDYADSLFDALSVEFTEDEDTVYRVFKKMKNISDVNKLISFYGKHRIAGTTMYLSLPATIARLFNESEKKQLNIILANRKINYKFN